MSFDSFLVGVKEEGVSLPEEVKDILLRCYKDTQFYAKLMFPEHFYRNWSSIHDEIFDFLDNCPAKKKLILAPRGFGKSSIFNLAYLSKLILFQKRHFIVPVSNTSQSAIGQSNNLREILVTNPTIKTLFGELQHKDDFSKEHWKTNTGITVFPKGAKQQIRGLLAMNHRPDAFVIDDLETDESVRSPEQRQLLKEWFFSALLNTIDPYKDDYEVNVIGTLLQEDSLLANLEKGKQFETVRFELCDDSYKSNWSEYITDEDCRAKAQEYRDEGLIDVFYREFRNIAVSDENRSFLPAYFSYYEEADLENSMALQSFIIIDPAKTSSKKADDTAIVGISVDPYKHRLYIRDIIAEKLKPDEMYVKAVEMAKRLEAKNIGVETTSLHDFILQPFQNYLSSFGFVYTLHELTAVGKKEDRIASMVPYYRQGCVFHNKANCTKLESQLESFPCGGLDDAADCLGYIPKMLAILNIFFAHPIEQSDGSDSEARISAEYESLEEVQREEDYMDYPGPLVRNFS